MYYNLIIVFINFFLLIYLNLFKRKKDITQKSVMKCNHLYIRILEFLKTICFLLNYFAKHSTYAYQN